MSILQLPAGRHHPSQRQSVEPGGSHSSGAWTIPSPHVGQTERWQTVDTSRTQIESHAVRQQNGSAVQMSATQAPHPGASAEPIWHSSWQVNVHRHPGWHGSNAPVLESVQPSAPGGSHSSPASTAPLPQNAGGSELELVLLVDVDVVEVDEVVLVVVGRGFRSDGTHTSVRLRRSTTRRPNWLRTVTGCSPSRVDDVL